MDPRIRDGHEVEFCSLLVELEKDSLSCIGVSRFKFVDMTIRNF